MSLLPCPRDLTLWSQRSSHSDGRSAASREEDEEEEEHGGDDEGEGEEIEEIEEIEEEEEGEEEGERSAARTSPASALRAESRTPTCLQVASVDETAEEARSNEGRGRASEGEGASEG